jgi:peptidoglycan/LPS O-acetylase OafA/YrhL
MSANSSPTLSTDAPVGKLSDAASRPVGSERSAPPGDRAPGRLTVLDGLRGLAICLILVEHFLPAYTMPNKALELVCKLAKTGWSGVDLSFVLSGLLITDVLLRTRGIASATKSFFIRRFLRVMPLYLGCLIFVFLLLPFFVRSGVDPAFDTMQSYQGWYWGLSANVISFLHGFPVMQSETVDLGHFWVVAIIQQFYFIWPLAVWSVSERKLPYLALGVIGLSLGLRIVGVLTLSGTPHDNVYYQTPTCLDSFAFGALVTLCFRQASIAWLRPVAFVVLPITAGIIGCFFLKKGLWENGVIHSVGLTLVSLAYASLIVLLRTSAPTSWFVRLFDNPFFRFFGKYSYGLYVFQGLLTPLLARWFPADMLLEKCHGPVLAAIVCVGAKVAVSLAAAMLSWRLLEAPCLRLFASSRANPSVQHG